MPPEDTTSRSSETGLSAATTGPADLAGLTELGVDRRELYRLLRASSTDPDALHELIALTDGEILDHSIPYVLVAIRNRQRSAHRSDQRRRGREQALSAGPTFPSPDAIDPAERVIAQDGLRRVAEAIATLPERDAWLLWWTAGGFSLQEIAVFWRDAGFTPTDPSESFLRLRRLRARKKLRAVLGAAQNTSDQE